MFGGLFTQVLAQGLPHIKPFMIAAGCIGASYATYRTLPTTRVKMKLLSVFRIAELPLPRIRSVSERSIVFTIPTGLNPAKVENFDWLFRQQFGQHIDWRVDGRKYTIYIASDGLKPYSYACPHIANMKLPILVGASVRGEKLYDMTEAPHLLIAGETGSGKSSALRAMLTTMILALPPSQLHLYLGDMKRSEFHVFRRIKHVEQVAVTADDLTSMLHEIKTEMDRRMDILDDAEKAGVQELDDPPPYVVVAIDEVAMLKREKEAMDIIEEISAVGRALGVFLILSMQRPDADVLDGKLKQNLTVRLAFRHADATNSRITIGSEHAADIPITARGQGFLKHERLARVQAPFLSVSKARKLLTPYRATSDGRESPVRNDKVFGILNHSEEVEKP